MTAGPGGGQPPRLSLTGLIGQLSENAAREGWGGPIAFILALGISIGLCASLIIISLAPKPLDTSLVSVITTLAGAAVGAVGTYLGVARHHEDDTAQAGGDGEGPATPGGEAGPGTLSVTRFAARLSEGVTLNGKMGASPTGGLHIGNQREPPHHDHHR